MSSIESKRVQYRKYLERAGVIDALSKALIKLYEEQNKPEDAIRFVRKYMCESCPDDAQFDALKADLVESHKTIELIELEMERLRDLVVVTPEEVAQNLEEGFVKLMEDEEKKDSLLRKYLTREVLDSYKLAYTSKPIGASLLDCIKSGLEHHDSAIGVFAADAESFDLYTALFESVIRDVHSQWSNDKEQLQPDLSWGVVEEIINLDPEKKYIQSTRLRITRNIEGFPLFPKLTEKDYVLIEAKVKVACEVLEAELAGVFLSMKDISDETKREMLARHILFAKGDRHLKSAGAYRFWPIGRAVFHNPAETFIVWVCKEEHVEIISMAKCGDLGDIYKRLIKGLEELEKNLQFGRHERFGMLAGNINNLGHGFKASVIARLPLLAKNVDNLQKLATDINLDIRGTLPDKPDIVDGVMIITTKKRLGFTEFEIIKSLQEGVITLIKAEKEVEAKTK